MERAGEGRGSHVLLRQRSGHARARVALRMGADRFAQGRQNANRRELQVDDVARAHVLQEDTVVRLSVSYFDKQMGKGKEVASDDVHEWRPREYPIRPNTYLAALKKEVCGGSKAAAG